MGKIILLEVFVDVDLLMDLIKEYNLVINTFHKNDTTILCTLDRETFIEVFDLGGPMTHIVDLGQVFNRCRRYEISLNPKKCSFKITK